jgi:hypothetical protein
MICVEVVVIDDRLNNSLMLERMSVMMMTTKYARCNKECTAVNTSELGFPDSEMLVAYVRQIAITSSRDALTVHIVSDSDAQRVSFRKRRLGRI